MSDDLKLGFATWKQTIEQTEQSQLELLIEYLYLRRDWHAELEIQGSNQNEQRPFSPNRQQEYRPYNTPNVRTSYRRPPNNAVANRNSFAFGTLTRDKEDNCVFCDDTHESKRCELEMPLSDRRHLLADKKVCFRCLRFNHTADKCRNTRIRCTDCKGRHYPIMCPKINASVEKAYNNSSDRLNRPESKTSKTSSHNACVDSPDAKKLFDSQLLMTGYAWVYVNNKRRLSRLLMDPGSQRSFVSDRLVKTLGVKPNGSQALVTYTIGGRVSKMQECGLFDLDLSSRFTPYERIPLSALGLPEITKGVLPKVSANHNLSPIADHLTGEGPNSIDILLGTDILPHIITDTVRVFGDLVATLTKFGWFFYGSEKTINSTTAHSVLCVLNVVTLPNQCPANAIESNAVVDTAPFFDMDKIATSEVDTAPFIEDPHVITDDSLRDLKFLWNVERLGIEEPNATTDSLLNTDLKQFFRETIQQENDGRYIVSLPFKPDISGLGDNLHIAQSRLHWLLKSTKKDKNLLAAIDNEISKALEAGSVEQATPRRTNEPAYYLPILAVSKIINETQELKVRVVKDAGARGKNLAALNDILYQGPSLLPDIVKVLIQFRKYPIAVTTDIEKAFHQFKINPEHRTFLRFLWPLNISKNPNAPILEFWATVLDFGLICSPWLHCEGLKYHLEQQQKLFPSDKIFISELSDNFYMDDVVFGAESDTDALNKFKLLKHIFNAGCFPLNKWATNSKTLADFIRKHSSDNTIVVCDNASHKFLGVLWDQPTDSIGVSLDNAVQSLRKTIPSKRTLLQTLAKIFDPLGILTPISIRAKMLLQTLWKNKIDWDDALTGSHLDEYNCLAQALSNHAEIKTIRSLNLHNNQNIVANELHVFSDASLSAYGCIVYLRQVSTNGSAAIHFVFAKARVAPLKQAWTIPRLELLGAVIAARVAAKIKEYIGHQSIHSVKFWCDNAAVLGWVRDSPEKWKASVANRISEIQALSNKTQWNYVTSKENPADLLSRGITLDTTELKKFWLSGPKWLRSSGQPDGPHLLNNTAETSSRDAVDTERKVHSTCAATKCELTDWPTLLDVSRFSSWSKAVRVVAYVLRFINKIKRVPLVRTDSSVTADEFDHASNILVKDIQSKAFSTELNSSCSNISKTSPIYQYHPFVDSDGLIRCRSRLESSHEFSYSEKYPVILPGDNPMIKLLIHWIHATRCLHSGGLNALLHQVRSKFLIIHGRRLARSVLSNCKICSRFLAKPAGEIVPPLPAFRVDRSPPFFYTGVDFAGPLFARNDSGQKSKCYIVLFCCATIRAVHVELVPDLSTYEFLLALRRFLNRRPMVAKIISDNALSFKRAAKEIKLIYDHIRNRETQSFLAERSISWEFITERAPQHGAWWERLVQVIKRPLRKILGTNCLPFRELATVLTDIESMVNLRPITTVASDESDIRAHCPADLLYGYRATTVLPGTSKIPFSFPNSSAIIVSKRWIFQQSILDSYWKRFKKEYLEYLRSAHIRNPSTSRPLQPGDICILHDPAPSRAFWPLVRVVSTFGGERSDLKRRSCTIQLPSGQRLNRPIHLLYKLEL